MRQRVLDDAAELFIIWSVRSAEAEMQNIVRVEPVVKLQRLAGPDRSIDLPDAKAEKSLVRRCPELEAEREGSGGAGGRGYEALSGLSPLRERKRRSLRDEGQGTSRVTSVMSS